MKIKKEKDGYKISATVLTNEELERLDCKLENNLDDLVNQITKAVLKERETIVLQNVIKKQQEEIEKLRNKKAENYFHWQHLEAKIINKINEYNKKCDECNFQKSEICKELKAHYNCSIQCVLEMLYELLGETK